MSGPPRPVTNAREWAARAGIIPWYAGGRAFSPRNLPDLALWLDASDLDTITESSGAVSQWSDKSGLQHHASQPVLNCRPALVLGAVNGLPAVRFDGSDDRLEILSPSGLDIARNVAGLTAIAVVNSTADGVTQRVFQANIAGSTGNMARFAIYKSGSNRAGIVARQSDSDNATATTTSELGATHAILSGVADYAGGSIRVLLNGQNPATAAISVGSTDDTASGLVWIGGGGGADTHLTGDIAEVIVYRQALSDEDRERVEAYLADKWGITLA